VGICHAVMKRIAPEVDVLDLTHAVERGEVLRGALALADALPYAPVGVHVAVVDPGVGTERRAVAFRGGDGRLYVGPDNGLLLPAAERLGGVREAFGIAAPEYMLAPVSATFHGRDVFAPAAAHLALGVAPAKLGPPVDPADLVRVEVPEATVEDGAVHAVVLDVDRFGNVALGATLRALDAAGLDRPVLQIEVGGTRRAVALGRTFADVAPGDLVLLEDASGRAALAVNAGDAAAALGVGPGDRLVLRAV
jgi:S-adenosylmethionine hydrolase